MMPLNNSAAARQLGWSHPINPDDSSFTCHFIIERTDRALEARQSWLYFIFLTHRDSTWPNSLWLLSNASGKRGKIQQDAQEEQVTIHMWQSKFNINDIILTLTKFCKLLSSKVMIPMQNRDLCIFDSSLFWAKLKKTPVFLCHCSQCRECWDGSSLRVNEVSHT